MSTLGKNVSYRRSQLGMTQNQLSAKASVNQSTVSRIESGEQINVGLDIVGRLAAALQTNIHALLS
jgi:transcriptional regulator with XRE-family HTH domain